MKILSKSPKKRRPTILLIAILTLVIFLPAAYYLTTHPFGAKATWFDDKWGYRQAISIASHTASENNVYVTVPAFDATDTTKFQADCGDLRFTQRNGELLPYYVVDCDATADIHVLFDNLPAGASTYYMYYGNPGAVNGTNPSDFSTAATGLGAQAAATEEKSVSPIGYWKIDEGYGNITSDSTGHGFTGTLTDTPTWQTDDLCVSGKCLFFNGTSNNVDMGTPAALDITGPMSVAGWFKVKDTSGATSQFIASKDFSTGNRGWGMAVSSSKLVFEKGGANLLTGATPLQNNTWYYAQVTFDGTTWKLYLNGVEDDSETGTGSLSNTNAKFIVGARHYVSSEGYLNGFVDDIKLYNYGRSAAQVKADFNTRGSTGTSIALGSSNKNLDGLTNGLVGYWKMDEASWNGTSGEGIDSSGNGNHGTAYTGTATVTGKFGNAGDFDGSYENLNIPAALISETNPTFSYSLWVKADNDANTQQDILAQARGGTNNNSSYELRYSGTSYNISLTNGAGSEINSYSYNLSSWTHIGVVNDYTNNIYQLYINGQLVKTGSAAGLPVQSLGAQFKIGTHMYDPYNRDFVGQVDEVRVYNRTLSSAEVKELYNWAPGPVGYWKMDGKISLTETVDSSGYGHNGAMDGFENTNWTAGKLGSSLNFDGTDNTVNVTSTVLSSVGSTSTFTFSAWVKPTTAQTGNSDRRAAVSIDVPTNQFEAVIGSGYSGTNYLSLEVGKAGVGSQESNSLATYSPGVWYYVTGVFRNGTADLFVNGVYQSSVTYNGTVNSATAGNAVLSIGGEKYNGAYDYHYNGQIDEVRVYNYARTPSQIIEDMNAGHPVGGSPIGSQIGYWKFDEGYDTTTHDSSPQGVNGAITDATWKNEGKIGRALFFDGAGDYVTLGNIAAYKTATKTVSFWANPSAGPSSTVGVVSADGVANWYVGFTSSGRMISSHSITAGTQQTTSSPNNTVPGKEWHYYAYVWDVSGSDVTVRQYKDGAKVTETAYTTGYSATYGSNFILGSFATGSLYYSGLLDEVKIYNSALTDDQIKLDFNRGSTQVLGSLSDTSAQSGGSVASSSASAIYCVPGSSDACIGPILEWNFEEVSGASANDTSSNGYTGTLTNSPSWVQGKIGKGLEFDGTTNYVRNTSITFNPSSPFTLSFWLKLTRTNNTDVIGEISTGTTCNGNPQVWISDGAGGSVAGDVILGRCGNGAGPDIGSASSIANIWTHIEFSYDGTDTRAYKNGVLVDTYTFTWPSFATSRLTIGASREETRLMEGIIDNVQIFNYARTPAQVAWDYGRGAPVGHWKFDECQGTTMNDSSGRGSSGTWSGSGGDQTAVGTCSTADTAWGNGAIGKFNSSLSFDGTDDQVVVASNPNIDLVGSPEITLAAWVNWNGNTTSNNYIIDKNSNKYLLSLEGEGGSSVKGAPRFYISGITGDAPGGIQAISVGNWHHIAGTYDGTTMKVYLDGVLIDSHTTGITAFTSGGNLIIGCYATCNTTYAFDGQIDDVRVYNYALTPTQIKNVLNQGSAIRFGPNTGAP